MAASSPAALAQFRGEPAQGAGALQVAEHWIDDQGVAWVTLQGRAVKLEEYQKLLQTAAGVPLADGTMVPKEEYTAAMAILDAAVAGRPS